MSELEHFIKSIADESSSNIEASTDKGHKYDNFRRVCDTRFYNLYCTMMHMYGGKLN